MTIFTVRSKDFLFQKQPSEDMFNYDGKNKAQTVIKDGAFIGSNVNLIAPITVGKDVYIGAGSTVSKDIESSTFVVERGEEKRKTCNKK